MDEISPLFAVEAEQLLLAGFMQEAIDLCNEGLAVYPDYPTGLAVLAKAYEMIGDDSNAEKTLKSALEISPNQKTLTQLVENKEKFGKLNREPLTQTTASVPEIIEELPIEKKPIQDFSISNTFFDAMGTIPEEDEDDSDEYYDFESDIVAPVGKTDNQTEDLDSEDFDIDAMFASQAESEQAEVNEAIIDAEEPELSIESPVAENVDEFNAEVSGSEDITPSEEILQESSIRQHTGKRHNLKDIFSKLSGKNEVEENSFDASDIGLIPGLEFLVEDLAMKEFEFKSSGIGMMHSIDIIDSLREKYPATKSTNTYDPFSELAGKLENAKIPQAIRDNEYDDVMPEEEYKSESGVVSETLANIYKMQGAYAKAIEAYQKLMQIYPDKSQVYSSKIEEIKRILAESSDL